MTDTFKTKPMGELLRLAGLGNSEAQREIERREQANKAWYQENKNKLFRKGE